ncbi:MAG: tetratricopeptide repeat protein, partial [Bryobacteraceae bacterium]
NYLQAVPEQQALGEAERLAAELPGSADAHYALGLLRARRGDRDRAVESFRQAIRLRDDFAEAHAALGEILGDLESLRTAVRIDPRVAAPRLNLGRLLYQSGNTAEGTREFRAVVRRHPAFAEAHLSLGVALGEQGDLDRAIREFREVLRLAPGNAEAAQNLRQALEMKR